MEREVSGDSEEQASAFSVQQKFELAWLQVRMCWQSGGKTRLNQEKKDAVITLVQHYSEHFASPYVAASRGYVQDIIEPRSTRQYLIDALETLDGKRVQRPNRKHGNIPL